MFLSFLMGIVISRLVRNKYILPLVAIVIGTLIGFLGAFGVFGMAYPFSIALDYEVPWYDNIMPFVLYFLTPQIRIYSFQSEWGSIAMPLMPIVVAILVITSVVSVLVGQLAGRRWFGRKD
ncbi:MAG: hypothetical protein ACTSWA_13845 [Candidatus Thorarchaeota archaeon]